MQSLAKTVDEYIENLPVERKEAIIQLRNLIKTSLPKGYEEGMQYGMISYFIPLDRYPNTYNGEPLGYVALASQKNYMSLYLMTVYGDSEQRFKEAYEKTGKKLEMGKSCLRFKSVDDLALDVIAAEIRSLTPDEYIAVYEKARNIH